MLHEKAKLIDNHDRFVRRAIEQELVWGLNGRNGFATCQSNDDPEQTVLLFWSDEAYARRAMTNGLKEYQTQSISLFDFLFRWLPGMDSDSALAGCNWTEDLAGIESQATDLQAELVSSMPEDMIQSYHDNVRQQIKDQK